MMDSFTSVLSIIEKAREEGRTLLSILVDPDKAAEEHLEKIVESSENQSDIFFVGGSLVTELKLDQTIDGLKKRSKKPVVLFPGSLLQISNKADALLFLTLISGRNPELLIGHHVVAAPMIRKTQLEVMPVGYMLIDGGKPTTASYMSHTSPIPANKPEIAVCTAMAGEMLGLKLLYLDAGSGAENPVSAEIISAVREATDLPIIVGGGIRTAEQAGKAAKAGATVVVVGNALEKDPGLISQLKQAIGNS
jgi:phosphoglycerol geranylgeranyltransferase